MKMAADLQALKDAVAQLGASVDAAVAALAAAKQDPAALAQITADVKAAADKLSAAVAPPA